MRNFLKTKFNKTNNSLKKSSNETFSKIGLFLIFGVMLWNINISTCGNLKSVGGDNNLNIIEVDAVSIASADGVDIIDEVTKFIAKNNANIKKEAKAIEDAGGPWNPVTAAFKVLLWGILVVIHWLALASAAMFDAVVNTGANGTKNIFDVVVRENKAVYASWAMVRDLLNMFFMLILLFSAFATIFQVEKYHLRKTIIMLVVMALLVNFSFPISRFIIDFSNSAMYFLIDLIQQSSGNDVSSKSALVAQMSNMGMLTQAIADKSAISALILSIIFQFIMFITLFAFAINLLIRILAFAILIILSPAGFVLSFFPSTKSMADSWWDNLFKYAIMGPVMIFFLLIANSMFNATGRQQPAIPSSSTDVGFIASSLLFTIPIVFLWIGLVASQKFGGAASASAMSFAKSTGGKIKSYAQKGAWTGTKAVGRFADDRTKNIATGTIGAAKMKMAQWNDTHKSASEARAAQFGNKIGVKGAKEKDMKRRSEEYKKNHAQPDELKALAVEGDAAAAYRLAEDKDMDQKTYDNFMKTNKDDSLRKAINSKTKQTRMDLVAVNTAETTLNDAKKLQEFKDKNQGTENKNDGEIKEIIIKQEMSKLGAEDYANQDWKAVSEQVDTLTKEGKAIDASLIKGAVSDAFKNLTPEAKNEMKKRLNGQKAAVLRDEFSVVTV